MVAPRFRGHAEECPCVVTAPLRWAHTRLVAFHYDDEGKEKGEPLLGALPRCASLGYVGHAVIGTVQLPILVPSAAATTAVAAATTITTTTTTAAAAAAVTATTTTTAATGTAVLAGTGLIDRQRPAHQLFAIQGRDGGLGLGVRGHVDEAETSRPTGLTVDHRVG